MQETQVWSLIWEEATRCRATKPMCHKYWSPRALEPVLHNKAEATAMRSLQTAKKSSPHSQQLEKTYATMKTQSSEK